MALRYAVANQAAAALLAAQRPGDAQTRTQPELPNLDGHIVATLDANANAVAVYRRLHGSGTVGGDEILLRYRVRNHQLKFATNAFFFQEGTAKRYEAARYGEFRVAADGELLLTGLRDRERRPL